MGLRVLVVDDETLARLRLRSLVAECSSPAAQVVGEAANAQEAVAWLAADRCDLVLLDIHMPGLDGMGLARYLRSQADAPAIVFVTAHAEHALQAFELDAVDYLTKPVRRDRLQAALQRVAQRGRPAAQAAAAPGDSELMLIVNDLGRRVRVPVSDVLYLKAELKYVTLRTATHTHVLDDSLTDLEQRLGPRFLRVHRNALVARRAMQALERRLVPGEGTDDVAEGWAVRVGPVGEWLTVSRRQVSAVKDAIAEGGL
ncbi:LytTR family DNA-binding domain-containing protein [Rhizobacter sp. Root1221]|uniref:LytR/AlgR family response regulator transcription factor n=1 Tax=Rhizobacter sp. Root1221 TaxID=1736433 RepID=UPI0006F960AC|nr:LytTR family DNA-binding domain-containing protein [Rhizobacter sp. Root1221]KQV83042.1 LytTR family transcriptional regulator [Rhizobacter sp. Root1221]